MSAEGLGPDDQDRQEPKTPLPKEGSDIFVQFSKVRIDFPPLEEIKRTFSLRNYAVTENVRIGRLLKVCVENDGFAVKDHLGETTSFYEGAYAAAQLFRADKKSRPAIKEESLFDCVENMKIRKAFLNMPPQDRWLKENERLSNEDKRDESLNMKVLDLAFDRKYPKAFVAGATALWNLYKTAEELEVVEKTPRQEDHEIHPLYIDNLVESFDKILLHPNNWEGLMSMQRENKDLYRYMKNKYAYMRQSEPNKSKAFLLGAAAAYNLFKMSAAAEGKIPIQIPSDFIELDMLERPIHKKSDNDSVHFDCDEEINFLCDDEQYDLFWDYFDQYEQVLDSDAVEGLLNGFSLVLRGFRTVTECSDLKNIPVNKNTHISVLIAEREARAKELRERAEELAQEEMDKSVDEAIAKIFERGNKAEGEL